MENYVHFATDFRSSFGRPLDYEGILEGPAVCGSPAEVVDRVGYLNELLGLDRHYMMVDLGGLPLPARVRGDRAAGHRGAAPAGPGGGGVSGPAIAAPIGRRRAMLAVRRAPGSVDLRRQRRQRPFGALHRLVRFGAVRRLVRLGVVRRLVRLGVVDRLGRFDPVDRFGRFGALDRFGRFDPVDRFGRFGARRRRASLLGRRGHRRQVQPLGAPESGAQPPSSAGASARHSARGSSRSVRRTWTQTWSAPASRCWRHPLRPPARRAPGDDGVDEAVASRRRPSRPPRSPAGQVVEVVGGPQVDGHAGPGHLAGRGAGRSRAPPSARGRGACRARSPGGRWPCARAS